MRKGGGFLHRSNDTGKSVPPDMKLNPVPRHGFFTVRQVGPTVSIAVYGTSWKVGYRFPRLVQRTGDNLCYFENWHEAT